MVSIQNRNALTSPKVPPMIFAKGPDPCPVSNMEVEKSM